MLVKVYSDYFTGINGFKNDKQRFKYAVYKGKRLNVYEITDDDLHNLKLIGFTHKCIILKLNPNCLQ